MKTPEEWLDYIENIHNNIDFSIPPNEGRILNKCWIDEIVIKEIQQDAINSITNKPKPKFHLKIFTSNIKCPLCNTMIKYLKESDILYAASCNNKHCGGFELIGESTTIKKAINLYIKECLKYSK